MHNILRYGWLTYFIIYLFFNLDSKLQEIIFQLPQLLHHNKLLNHNTILNHNTNPKIISNINHNNNHKITMTTTILMMDNMIQDLTIQASTKEMLLQPNTFNQPQLQSNINNNNLNKLTTTNTLTNNNNNNINNIQQKVLTDSNHQANFH